MLKSKWSQLRNILVLLFRGDYFYFKSWVKSKVSKYREKNIVVGCARERKNNGDYKIVMFIFDNRSRSVVEVDSFQVPLISEEFDEKFGDSNVFIEESGIVLDGKNISNLPHPSANLLSKESNFADLKVFLCYASEDKLAVRTYYEKLNGLGVKTWIDEKDILPGQKWEMVIQDKMKNSDIVIVFLSRRSITKRGYIQKEIRYALSIAEEMPEDAIFIIPARLEECEVPFSLKNLQWVNLYENNGFEKIQYSLKFSANFLKRFQ